MLVLGLGTGLTRQGAGILEYILLGIITDSPTSDYTV